MCQDRDWAPRTAARHSSCSSSRPRKRRLNLRKPRFFFQAANDFDLSPSKTLAAEMNEVSKMYKLKIYPPCGDSPSGRPQLWLLWIRRVGRRRFRISEPVLHQVKPNPPRFLPMPNAKICGAFYGAKFAPGSEVTAEYSIRLTKSNRPSKTSRIRCRRLV